MKKLITAIVVGAFAFVGAATNSDARPHYGHSGYEHSSNHTYVSGYRHGRQVYTQRYIAGYDCHGYPIYRYRQVVSSGGGHCDSGYNQRRSNYRHYDRRGHSNSRVSFRFGR